MNNDDFKSDKFTLPKLWNKYDTKRIEGRSIYDMLKEFIRSGKSFNHRNIESVELILYRRNVGEALYQVDTKMYRIHEKDWILIYPEEKAYLGTVIQENNQLITKSDDFDSDFGTFIVLEKAYLCNILNYFKGTEKELLEGVSLYEENNLPKFKKRYYGSQPILNAVLDRMHNLAKVEQNTVGSSIFLYSGFAELIQAFVNLNFPIMVLEKEHEIVPNSIMEEEKRRISYAINLIMENYNKEINLDQLAESASLSKFHFLRVFKSVSGLTPHQYITKVRMEKAQELIKTTDLSLEDVCEQIGLSSIEWFRRMFKKTFGYSPSTVRKKK